MEFGAGKARLLDEGQVKKDTAKLVPSADSTDNTQAVKPSLSFRTSSKTQALKARKAALDARINASRRTDASKLSNSPRAEPYSGIPQLDRKAVSSPLVTSASLSSAGTSARSDSRRIARIQELEKQVADLQKRLSLSAESNSKLSRELKAKDEELLKKGDHREGVQVESRLEESDVPTKEELDKLQQKVARLEKERSEERATHHNVQLNAETERKVLENRYERELTRLQAELQSTKDEIEGLSLDKEQFEVEKDLAEEKVEDLELELEQAQQASTLLQTKISDMQALIDSRESLSEEEKSKDVLLNQNSKLREALKRLHESSLQDKSALSKELKGKEKEIAMLTKSQEEVGKLRESNKSLEEQIEHLKGIVDTCEAHGSMIETLSERNLELTEANEDMKRQTHELEEMREIADELEKHHVEYETQLLQDLDQKDVALQTAKGDLARAADQITAAEDIQQKLKELVAALEQDKKKLLFDITALQKFKSSLLAKTSSERDLNIRSFDAANEVVHLRIVLLQAQSKAAQAEHKLGFLESFLQATAVSVHASTLTFLDDMKQVSLCLAPKSIP